MNNCKLGHVILVAILSMSITSPLYAQSAYGQLKNMVPGSVNVPGVNGPANVSGSQNSSENKSMAEKIAGYQRKSCDYNNKGVLKQNRENYSAAIAAYKKALWYDPYNETARNNLRSARKALKEDREQKTLKKEGQRRRAEAEAREVLERQIQEEKAKAIQITNIQNTVNNLDQSKARIASLKKDVDRIQNLLKMYTKSLHNNSDELDKWGKTVDVAYNNTLGEAKDYALDYLSGKLLDIYKPHFKDGLYKRFNFLMNSDNPGVKQWFLEELADRHLTPDNIEKAMNAVTLSASGASLLVGGDNEVKYRLEALLFVNDIFETAGWVNYKGLITSDVFQKAIKPGGRFLNETAKELESVAPSELFSQAKTIGEVYSDLVIQCVSWKTINRLSDTEEKMSQSVTLLIAKQKVEMQQLDCLQECIQSNSADAQCMFKCTGKTKYHTPPPMIEQ
jgi:tetratricopeptide (TPR) repeat protein